MNKAAEEWAARVAAWDAAEVAKARADSARKGADLAARGFLPLTYAERLLPLGAVAKEAE